MAAREDVSRAMGHHADTPPGRRFLTQHQRLEIHAGLFAVAGWNVTAFDFAYTPDRLWSWPFLAGWAALLIIHAGVVFLGPRFTARGRQPRPKAPHGARY
jgi:hypothetical protein